MEEILKFLEKEKEREIKLLKEEFEKEKEKKEKEWKEKIEKLGNFYQKLLEEKKKEFLEREERKRENEKNIKIQNEILKWLDRLKIELKEELLNLPKKEKEEIIKIALRKIENLVNKNRGIFFTNKFFVDLIKKEFENVEIKIDEKINFGFSYFDRETEIIFNEDYLVERFFEKVNFALR
jgi:vacuolar-type H+-ATPase subunit E/Vma4